MTAEQKTEMSSAFGLGRIGEPADTAAVVAFLASEDAGFVTGRSSTTRAASAGPSGWIASNQLEFGTRRAGETGRRRTGRGWTGGTRLDGRDGDEASAGET
jgi:hypothetical protein